MSDLTAMLWKEAVELIGHRRVAIIFAIVVVIMGIFPALIMYHRQTIQAANSLIFFGLIYVLLGIVVVVGQTASDLVLHERVGHTLDYLLTTRLSAPAIFAAKILLSAAIGYLAALLVLLVQLAAVGLIGGMRFHWLFLGLGAGQVAAFGVTAALSLYVSVVGTFVALRVGEQRSAYLLSVVAVGLLLVPFILGWLHMSLTLGWISKAALVLGVIALALAAIGMRVFRRHMLVLYLQD